METFNKIIKSPTLFRISFKALFLFIQSWILKKINLKKRNENIKSAVCLVGSTVWLCVSYTFALYAFVIIAVLRNILNYFLFIFYYSLHNLFNQHKHCKRKIGLIVFKNVWPRFANLNPKSSQFIYVRIFI